MNKQEKDILTALYKEPYINQRILSDYSGHSLGIVNKSIKNLMTQGYLNDEVRLTKKAKDEFNNNAPKNAIILAAGYGMRMVPINVEYPKALIEINGEPLIERILKQLHEVGIEEIYVVVGFMKEKFEYLIDEFGVELIVNNEYSLKNNLHSLNLVSNKLNNSYIIPCDIWCNRNPFDRYELYSWYMVTDFVDDESDVRINRKMELVKVDNSTGGNSMIGISYLTGDVAKIVRSRLNEFDNDGKYDGLFWEETLYENDRMILSAKVVHALDFIEINTYEQLRDLDEDSNHLKTDSMEIIAKELRCDITDISNVNILKKGMTNRSFMFDVNKCRYIMRIPGEGTDSLINRKEEEEVYKVIIGTGMCDNPVYFNSKNGYKITKYIENSRICDPDNIEDLNICMNKLKELHSLKLQVNHAFDIFEKINFYESLWNGKQSVYRDYKNTKKNVFLLKEYIDKHILEKCLTHIDAVPDNFLIDSEGNIQLIDWEYAGMQDPHVDIAMFCIYSLYGRSKIDQLIDIYFDYNCPKNIRIKIYCYIAACGLLWSNWCEYKRNLGVEFGEYSIRQYRYAKDFYRIAVEEMGGSDL